MNGAPEQPLPIAIFGLPPRRRQIAGSSIGGTLETRDARFPRRAQYHRRRGSDSAQQINEAYERLLKSDAKYRFVIDMASLK